MRFRKRRTGFTLVELVIVIAIIAILAAVILVSVNNYISKSKDTAVKADMSSLEMAATKYIYDNNGQLTGFAGSTDYNKISTALDKVGNATGTLHFVNPTNTTNWTACAQLVYNSTSFWCLDSFGKRLQIVGTCNDSVLSTGDCATILGTTPTPTPPPSSTATPTPTPTPTPIPLVVSCYPSPAPTIVVGQSTNFSASVSGGNGSYSYTWSGVCSGSLTQCTYSAPSSGTYSEFLTIISGGQTQGPVSCSPSLVVKPRYCCGGNTCRDTDTGGCTDKGLTTGCIATGTGHNCP
jgi:prepilin-type N-terminal cleavage/methylation domain-containing protein